MRIGIAVHSGKLKIVYPEDVKTINCVKSELDILLMDLKKRGISEVLICGNRRWVEPLYFYLSKSGIQVRYLPLPAKGRGQRMSLEETLKRAFAKGIRGQPFVKITKEESSHRWLSIVKEHFKLQHDIVRIKLRIQGILREMVPELFVEGNLGKLFTKKGFSLLKERNWIGLIEYVTERIIRQLLIDFIDKERLQKLESDLEAQLQQLEELEKKKAELIREIESITEDHPIVKYFDGALSAHLFVLAVCWKRWKDTRELRRFCGLAITRIDSKGKERISRARSEIRAILYLILKTKKAQVLVKARLDALGRTKAPLPKLMELLLKCIWKEFRALLKKEKITS